MANRIFGNVIIVDSAMGNLSVVGGASSNITSFNVSGFGFWFGTTAGNCVFTMADTGLDHIAHFQLVSAGTGTHEHMAMQYITFSNPLRCDSLKVPTLSAGTGWVYLA
mgnify:CR=1 FL=1